MSIETSEAKLRQKPILKEEEFAAIVRRSRETVARLRRNGEIDHCQRGRMIWYLNPAHVDAFNRKFEKRAAA